MQFKLLIILSMLMPAAYARPQCQKPILIRIDLSNRIDRGVLKRTTKKCRLRYQGSPCLKSLTQISPGAFHAICSDLQVPSASQAVATDMDLDNESIANCSQEIFEANASNESTWHSPLPPESEPDFCPAYDLQ